MKIILVGTPNFSVPTFEKIINNFEVIALISQPNRKIGRSQIMSFTPVSMLASKYKIKLYQPEKIIDIYEELKLLNFDLLITMAYGQIIPEEILKLAKMGSFNIHASLLPKYRGASPIQFALINGDNETGITFMEMIKKMDAGDILFQSKIEIDNNDNYETLMNKLSLLSVMNVVNWINQLKDNDFKKNKQDEELATYAPKISSEDEKLMFDTMEATWNKIRALSPNPCAYYYDENRNNKRVKIFKASKTHINNAIEIVCKDGSLWATIYQYEGKNKVTLINKKQI